MAGTTLFPNQIDDATTLPEDNRDRGANGPSDPGKGDPAVVANNQSAAIKAVQDLLLQVFQTVQALMDVGGDPELSALVGNLDSTDLNTLAGRLNAARIDLALLPTSAVADALGARIDADRADLNALADWLGVAPLSYLALPDGSVLAAGDPPLPLTLALS